MTPLSTRAPVKSLWTTALFFALLVSVGCQSRFARIQTTPPPVYEGISKSEHREDLSAMVTPPVGWVAEPIKESSKHVHQIWLSPSKNTAYGIIYFDLPWPVGQDLVLTGFLAQMRKTEGRADLLEKSKDPNLPGLRFVAEGGLYRVRTNLIVDGRRAWAIYAGTVLEHDVEENELEMAELARESTRVGATKKPGSTTKPSQSIEFGPQQPMMTGADTQ
jgi:hypothetical protein